MNQLFIALQNNLAGRLLNLINEIVVSNDQVVDLINKSVAQINELLSSQDASASSEIGG